MGNNWKPIVGLSFSHENFDAYCHQLQWTSWRPSFVVLHNTGSPTLAQRSSGFTAQHIKDLVTYYRDEKGWSAGPHLFIDDRQIWVFTPLNMSGVHSPSWNKLSIGVEMLGNYQTENFTSGRGLKVRKNTIAALVTLHSILGLSPETLKLHKEDENTTHDDCPGKNVLKSTIIEDVKSLIRYRHSGEHNLIS